MRVRLKYGQKVESLLAEKKVAIKEWVELLSDRKWDRLGKEIVVVDEIANHVRF